MKRHSLEMRREMIVQCLATLAAEFVADGCTMLICDCAEPPTSVQCIDGRCVPGDE